MAAKNSVGPANRGSAKPVSAKTAESRREQGSKKGPPQKKSKEQSQAAPEAKVKKTAPKREIPKSEVSKKKKTSTDKSPETIELKETLISSSRGSGAKSKTSPAATLKSKPVSSPAKLKTGASKTAIPSKPLNKSQKKFQMKLDRATKGASGGKK